MMMIRTAAIKASQRVVTLPKTTSSRSLVTSAQKRALNKNQLAGKKDDVTTKTAATAPSPTKPKGGGVGGGGSVKPPTTSANIKSTTPPPSGPSGGSSSGGGGGGMFLPAAGLVAAAAGGAYYMDLFPKSTEEVVDKPKVEAKPDAVVDKKEETPKKVVEEVVVVKKKETVKKTEASKEMKKEEEVINKVTQIQAPPKDTTRVMESPPPVQHAEDAHRVTMEKFGAAANLGSIPSTEEETKEDVVVVEKPKADVDITAATAVEAEAELKAVTDDGKSETDLELAKAHASLRANLDDSLFKDLDSLSISQLRVRVVQLAAEMQERTKWEAVRLREFLAIKEREVGEKYLEKMQKQRLEFEDLLARRLREQEDALTKQANAALNAKDESFQSIIDAAANTKDAAHELALRSAEDRIINEVNTKAEEEVGLKLAEMKEAFANEMEAKVAIIEKLTERLEKNEQLLNISRNFEDGSQRAHRVSAAALALAEKLETNQSAAEELAALKAASVENGVIASALSKLPNTVKSGVPTLSELQTSYDSVHTVGRQAAYVPSGRLGLEGQLAGIVFSKLSVAPSPETTLDKDASDSQVADYTLASAKRHVQLGELEQAVEDLDKLKGQTAYTMRDWKSAAKDRIALEKALKIIKMECALMNKNMGG